MNRVIFFLLLCVVTVWACSKDEDQATKDRNTILAFIDDNNIDATEHSSGLYYAVDVPGSDGSPVVTDSVEVKYTGYLPDGLIFDQTPEGQTRSFLLDDLIPGWKIGIPLVEKGGKIQLILPSALAYGSNGPLANLVLVFDIELVDYGF